MVALWFLLAYSAPTQGSTQIQIYPFREYKKEVALGLPPTTVYTFSERDQRPRYIPSHTQKTG